MTDEAEALRLLASIDRRLALLTTQQERDLRNTLGKGLLRTQGRVAMFDMLDGAHTSQEIAKSANVSERAVQLFVKELLDLGLVRDTGAGSGRSVIVERNDAAIVEWFVKRKASE